MFFTFFFNRTWLFYSGVHIYTYMIIFEVVFDFVGVLVWGFFTNTFTTSHALPW